MDGYHAGFPCNTFSKLRHRVAANMPGLVRTKSGPYRRQDNTDREQAQCDEGTILACRAIGMAVAVAERKQVHRVPPVATLENPLPSDCPEHISAWELPEMVLQKDKGFYARFNTCRYESGVELGKRHFKPQQFAGSLLGLPELSKECQCGARAYCGPGEVAGVGRVSGEALQGVRQLGGVSTEVDGEGGIPEVENGILAGQDRENEGCSGGSRCLEQPHTAASKPTEKKVTNSNKEDNKTK